MNVLFVVHSISVMHLKKKEGEKKGKKKEYRENREKNGLKEKEIGKI